MWGLSSRKYVVGKDRRHVVEVVNGLPSVLVSFLLLLIVICGFMVSQKIGKGLF